jgi:Mg-chelatase subunit ChlD
MTIFVVDASIKTDRATMETIRREIKLFIENRPSPQDAVAIISASSTPEIACDPTTNSEFLTLALGKLSTLGGNAIRDGIQTAFTIFSDLTTKEYRRAIVVFTSGKDTSSQTSTAQFVNRAGQLVGRKNVDLFVLGLGAQDADFGDLPSLVQQAGGAFIRTNLASLPADLFPVSRRVQ